MLKHAKLKDGAIRYPDGDFGDSRIEVGDTPVDADGAADGARSMGGGPLESEIRPDAPGVLQLNLGAGTCRLLSIPWDTRTVVPGYGWSKVNYGYDFGGAALETATVEGLLGIGIDRYGAMDMQGFAMMVDLVGGIEVGEPEVLPVERLWPLLNEAVANRAFADVDTLEAALVARCRTLRADRPTIRDLTRNAWWPDDLNASLE